MIVVVLAHCGSGSMGDDGPACEYQEARNEVDEDA